MEILKDWDPRRGLSVVGPHVEEVEPENGREEEVASLRKELACSLDLIDQAEIEMEWLRQEKFRAQVPASGLARLCSLHEVYRKKDPSPIVLFLPLCCCPGEAA